jgi:hypothetical protein
MRFFDEGGPGGGEVRVLDGQVVGHFQGVDGGADDGVVGGFGDTLAEEVDGDVAVAEAFDVVVAGADGGEVGPKGCGGG